MNCTNEPEMRLNSGDPHSLDLIGEMIRHHQPPAALEAAQRTEGFRSTRSRRTKARVSKANSLDAFEN
jgi:hypothetical protein